MFAFALTVQTASATFLTFENFRNFAQQTISTWKSNSWISISISFHVCRNYLSFHFYIAPTATRIQHTYAVRVRYDSLLNTMRHCFLLLLLLAFLPSTTSSTYVFSIWTDALSGSALTEWHLEFLNGTKCGGDGGGGHTQLFNRLVAVWAFVYWKHHWTWHLRRSRHSRTQMQMSVYSTLMPIEIAKTETNKVCK